MKAQRRSRGIALLVL